MGVLGLERSAAVRSTPASDLVSPRSRACVTSRTDNASRSIGFVRRRLGGFAFAFAFLYLRFRHEQDVHLERIATTRLLGARRFLPSCA